MKVFRILSQTGALGLLALFLCQAAPGSEARTWTDVGGKTIEAKLTGLDLKNGMVRLELEEGREVSFPLNRLSEADRTYVRANSATKPETAARTIDRLILKRLDRAVAPNSRNRDSDSRYPAEMRAMAMPASPLNDEQFLQRIYSSIAGRNSTPAESSVFLGSADPDKRAKLIGTLIDSEEFVNHFLGFLSDLLRIDGTRPKAVAYPECKKEIGREEIAKNRRLLKPPPPPDLYRDWVKKQIRDDRSWNQLVTEILTATGTYSDNPATGYLLAEHGVRLLNPSHTMTAFAGTEITCAQCHDHPYEEVYQMDFYRATAFFGELRFKNGAGNPPGSDVTLGDESNLARIPADYKYNDADPGDHVPPGIYFGAVVDLEKHETAREAFAVWLTAESNPRFTINIVNRLWEHVFGTALVEPVYNLPGHLGDNVHDLELLEYLCKLMRENGYRLKEFLKILYKTETFSGIKSGGNR